MSLLGIDVGTTGCKAAAFSEEGHLIAAAYEEYDVKRPNPGWAELDVLQVWQKIKHVIAQVVARSPADPVKALAVSSLGEAVVPVTAQRQVLGPSFLNFDQRGEEYLADLGQRLSQEQLYRINSNTLGNHYSLTKLKWLKAHYPELYQSTYKFLHWSGFVAFMLGGEPVLSTGRRPPFPARPLQERECSMVGYQTELWSSLESRGSAPRPSADERGAARW